jgi:hypothetical protein
MPKGASDGLGIRYTGTVLTGETTPEAKRLAEAVAARRPDLGEYDPISSHKNLRFRQ